MALFKPGRVGESVSGRTGSALFRTRSRFGVLSHLPRRVGGRSPAAAATSRAQSGVLQSWQRLTDSQRAAWNLHADTVVTLSGAPGDRRLSGFNRYAAVNGRRLAAGQPLLQAGPPDFVPAEATQRMDVVADLATEELVVRTLDGVDFVTLRPLDFAFYLHRPHRGQSLRFRAEPRLAGHALGVVDFFPWSASPLRLPSPWPLEPGNSAWFETVVQTEDGILGPPRRTFLWLPQPGHVFAFRARPRFVDARDWSLQVLDNVITATSGSVGGTTTTHTATLGPGGLETVAEVRSWVDGAADGETRDFDAATGSVDARQIAPFAQRFVARAWNLIPIEVPQP